MRSDDVRNRWVEGFSYRGGNIFTELFTQMITDNEVGRIYEIKVVF